MLHPLACSCGALRGTVDSARPHNRIVCYCADCQAYAGWLGRTGDVLDARGGSDVLQTVPSAITLTQGSDRLACVRMTGAGPLRWYADCCNTPIGNTAATYKAPFVGLVSTCLGGPGPALDAAFGPVRMWGFVAGAKGDPKPPQTPFAAILLRIIGRGLKERFAGRHRRTPFFDPATDTPAATPRTLTAEERAQFLPATAAA